MKKLNQLAILALAAAMAIPAIAQDPSGQAQPGAPQQKKEIKDPAEYNAYVAAIGMGDAGQKAAALEQFLQQYPNTVMKSDALQQIMGAYQQANNIPKATDAATRILQVDPNNVAALYLLALVNKANAQTGNAPAAAAARQYGDRGLQALPTFNKPEGMAADAYQKAMQEMKNGFNGAAGLGAFLGKDYPAAQKYLSAAVQGGADDFLTNYQLAAAYLEIKPANPLGFWYGARAINLSKSSAPANAQITKYVQAKYQNYHGGTDGWDQTLQSAATQSAPPANFTVTQITPAVQAKQVDDQIKGDCKNGEPNAWGFIFQNGDQQLADKCLTEIKGTPFQFEGKIVTAKDTELTLAATEDDKPSNTADAQVTMAAAIPAKMMPKVGATQIVQAVPVSYDKQPYMLHLEQGKLVTVKKPAPAHRPVHHKRPAAH